MKKIILSLSLILTYFIGQAQTETLDWALNFGGDFDFLAAQEDARQVATDADGNVYMTGTYYGTVDFDPGEEVFNLNSPNDPFFQRGTYILKLSERGELIWAKQLSGNDEVKGWEIALDDAGNVHVGGTFEGTADFDPGAGVYNLSTASPSFTMLFVVKLTNSGDFVWAKHYAEGGSKYFFDMDIDPSGNVLLAGRFAGTTDFDPGAGVVSRTSIGTAIFSFDGFVLKLDSSGDFVWVDVFAGANESDTESVTTDAAGNVYCSGTFTGPVDLDPEVGVLEFTASFTDSYMVKLNPSGGLIWGKAVAGTGSEIATSIKLDGDGDIFLAGHFSGTTDFDLGENVFNLTSAGSADIFVAKYTDDGNLIWANSMGGLSIEQRAQLAIGPMGEAIITGTFRGLADFDPGAGVFNLESIEIDQYDVFVSILDADGNFLNAFGVFGSRQNLSYGIAADATGSIYVVGEFEARSDFGARDEPFELRVSGRSDGYIFKMSGCGNPTAYVTGCPDCDGVVNGSNRPGRFDLENGVPVIINYECESTPFAINDQCNYFMSDYDSIGGVGFGLTTIYQLYFDPTPGSTLVLMAEIWQVTYRASLAYDADNQLLYAVALDLPLLEVIDLQNFSSYPVFDPQTQSVSEKTGAAWHDGLLYVAAESPRNIYTYDVNTGASALVSPGQVNGGDIAFDGNGDLLLLSQGPRQSYSVNSGGLNELIGPIPSFVEGAMTGPDGNILMMVKGSRFLRSMNADGQITNTTYSLSNFGLPFIPGEGDLASGCSNAAGFSPANAVTTTMHSPDALLSSQPNPTNDISVATFTLPTEQRTTLSVYDLSGRLVQNLYNAVAEAGITYRLPFDTHQLPAGVYIYRLTTDSETTIEKFMVTK